VLSRLAAEALALLAPPACAACRAPLRPGTAPLCAGCRARLPWLREPPRPEGPVRAAWAPFAHEGVAREVVQAFKFRGALPIADLMAAQIAAGAPRGLLDGAVLVPVPAHPRRSRRRGFDHAERLTKALAARTGRPLRCCLRRGGAPARQVGAARAERLAPGRLEVGARGPVPARVLLVDDVRTTGATLVACAHAALDAGAARVDAVTYARALAR
jgi:predicted amidophosphoribosyltransferase